MDLESISIHPIHEAEINLLPRGLRPDEHLERYARQQRGDEVYLTAWDNKHFVGQLVLMWAGETREPMVSALSQCPNISNFHVESEYRSHGIGSRMMDYAESMVREQGYQRIGLGVHIENIRAQELYKRRGYHDSGLGIYLDMWAWIDDEGREHPVEDVCMYMVKVFEAPPALF